MIQFFVTAGFDRIGIPEGVRQEVDLFWFEEEGIRELNTYQGEYKFEIVVDGKVIWKKDYRGTDNG